MYVICVYVIILLHWNLPGVVDIFKKILCGDPDERETFILSHTILHVHLKRTEPMVKTLQRLKFFTSLIASAQQVHLIAMSYLVGLLSLNQPCKTDCGFYILTILSKESHCHLRILCLDLKFFQEYDPKVIKKNK